MRSIFILGALAGSVLAQAGPYEQCGGLNHQGPTECADGATCTFINEFYSPCIPADGGGGGVPPPGVTPPPDNGGGEQPPPDNGGGGQCPPPDNGGQQPPVQPTDPGAPAPTLIPTADPTLPGAPQPTVIPPSDPPIDPITPTPGIPTGPPIDPVPTPIFPEIPGQPDEPLQPGPPVIPRQAAAGPFEQCGGTDFEGSTTCTDGFVCEMMDETYSICLPSDLPPFPTDGFPGFPTDFPPPPPPPTDFPVPTETPVDPPLPTPPSTFQTVVTPLA